MFKPGRDES